MTENFYTKVRLIEPRFDSKIVETTLFLDRLRAELFRLRGTTPSHLFYQIREIFELMEVVGSARIEGNRTTISEYAEQKTEKTSKPDDKFQEIENLTKVMNYVDSFIERGDDLSHSFIRDIHRIVVEGLQPPPKGEGDHTPGSYRIKNVKIQGADHIPPDATYVHGYMDELLRFIQEDNKSQFDLIKIALFHHRFCWIHPFNNGNGRVVRMLTYALLLKFGFSASHGILNPTAVFCTDRDAYYNHLSMADNGTDEGLEAWCLYVLEGFQSQFTKIKEIATFETLKNDVLVPTLERSLAKAVVSPDEFKILMQCLSNNGATITIKDLEKVFPRLTVPQRRYKIKKMYLESLLSPVDPARKQGYMIKFNKLPLLRSLLFVLYEKGYSNGLENY